MPMIILEGPELTQEQRDRLIKGFTDVACETLPNIRREAFVVFLREYPPGNVGVGGLPLPEYLEKRREV